MIAPFFSFKAPSLHFPVFPSVPVAPPPPLSRPPKNTRMTSVVAWKFFCPFPLTHLRLASSLLYPLPHFFFLPPSYPLTSQITLKEKTSPFLVSRCLCSFLEVPSLYSRKNSLRAPSTLSLVTNFPIKVRTRTLSNCIPFLIRFFLGWYTLQSVFAHFRPPGCCTLTRHPRLPFSNFPVSAVVSSSSLWFTGAALSLENL